MIPWLSMLIAMLLVMDPAPVVSPPVDIRATLDAYRAHTQRAPNCSFSSQTDIAITGARLNTDEDNKTTVFFEYIRRGNDTDITRFEAADDGGAGKAREKARRIQLKGNMFGAQYFEGLPEPLYAVHLFEDLKETGRDGPELLGGEWLDGFMGRDGVHVATLLSRAEKVNFIRMSEVDGHTCVVLEGEVPGRGNYALWLSPAHEHAALRAVVVKRGKDLYFDKPLDEPYPPYPPGVITKPNFPSDTYTEVRQEMDQVTFTEIEGGLVPTGCVVTRIQTYPDGQQTTFTHRHSRKDINLHPDLARHGIFETAIPDGTRLGVINRKEEYLFRGGSLEPVAEKVQPDAR